MTIIALTLIVFAGSILAGFLGSLTGLGGGIVIIPMLTLVFGVDIRYAIGTSIIAVIATSSGAAAAYVKEGITNIRLGMFLEIATTIGAIAGALLAVYAPTNLIAIVFGFVLIFSALISLQKKIQHIEHHSGSLAARLKLNNNYPDYAGTLIDYSVKNIGGGFLLMLLAGILSGLLGIGSGALKVLAMDNVMHIPFKVSTTTSNFMIGVTAATSAVVYFQRGYIDPGLCLPVTLGVLAGATFGSRILTKSETKWLRVIFAIVITVLALEMIYNGATHRL
jgi:uncharacterized membrane protein YfcA